MGALVPIRGAGSESAVGVVVVSWNVRELLRACLASVGASSVATRVVVVDNASWDDSAQMVREAFPAVRLVASARNLGFPRGNNVGLRILRVLPAAGEAAAMGAAGTVDTAVGVDAADAAGGMGSSDPSDRPPPPPYVLLLNPDAELLPGALEALVGYLEASPGVGAVGPQLLNTDGSSQSSRRRFPTLGTGLFESTPAAWHWPDNPWVRRYHLADVSPTVAGPVDWVTGAAILLRSTALAAVGGFDEGFFLYSEELDLCRRLAGAGWPVHFLPTARVLHHEGQSSDQVAPARHRYFHRSRVRYFHKHHGRLAGQVVRLGVIAQFGAELLLEVGKGLAGHKPALRRGRIAAYWALLRDGLA